MKLVTFRNSNRVGFVANDKIYPIEELDGTLKEQSLKQLLPQLSKLTAQFSKWQPTENSVADQPLSAPIPDPEKVICIGVNYADHAAESGSAVPEEPVVFNKFPTAIRGHEQNIELTPHSSSIDYEAELVVVIGREGKNIAEADALDYVAGYTCGHDVSARDWQKNKPEGQWLCGKSFDSFAPAGPYLVTADEVPDPHNLKIRMLLNGEEMQNSNTSFLIFNINQLIAYISKVCTLRPGDLIFTGTPPGVGAARTPPVFLKPGDVAEVEIEGLGVLLNPVVAGS